MNIVLKLALPRREDGLICVRGDSVTPVGPHTSRGVFLSSELGGRCSAATVRPPYFEYSSDSMLMEPVDVPIRLQIRFEGDSILSCSVTLDEPRDWSEEAELSIKAKQDRILRDHYGKAPPLRFSWGAVSSQYHPQHCGADIAIVYRAPSWAAAHR